MWACGDEGVDARMRVLVWVAEARESIEVCGSVQA